VNRALFLDRDGVLNVEYGHVFRIEDFVIVPGIISLLRFAQEQDFCLIVLTNQAGIAKGLYTLEDFQHLTFWMRAKFASLGVHFDEVYYCPHHPDFTGDCDCRKPKPGLIYRAASEFDLDLSQCALIGDRQTDLEAAKNAGIALPLLLEEGLIEQLMEKFTEFA
jgi:D-glycero-D-manno-heptose 1,7-bisphosphate phosphatase